MVHSLAGGITESIKFKCLILTISEKTLAREFIVSRATKVCLLITLVLYLNMRKMDKCPTSQSRGIKTKKSSKLFELTLASVNCRYIFLFYSLKLTETGQFARAKS